MVVLDVMLPGIDGLSVPADQTHRPVADTLLTARSDDIDVVVGLESGADDYVVKPVQGRVLDARIRAVLRRGERESTDSAAFGSLVIDRSAMTVTKTVRISSSPRPSCWPLLELSQAGAGTVPAAAAAAGVGTAYLGDSRLVDACVQRLRARSRTCRPHRP